MQITATPFLHPVAHTDCISSEALARVGLPTMLAPTRAGEIRFETPVGATGAGCALPDNACRIACDRALG